MVTGMANNCNNDARYMLEPCFEVDEEDKEACEKTV